LSSLFASAAILIQYLAAETEPAMVVFRTLGDAARSNWREIAVMAGAVTLCTGCMSAMRRDFNARASDEETAMGLGVDVEKLRIPGMMPAALVAALATAFHGIIAFIGLIAPHMARRLAREDHGLLISLSNGPKRGK
jgi:iron complex transport system permease protein